MGTCLWFLASRLHGLDAGAVFASLRALHPRQWGFGLTAVAVAFWSVGRQEQVVLRHMGIRIDRLHVMTAAMATAGVSQCVGFGPVVGAVIRARLLPGLTLRQSFMVSAATTMGFFGGAGLVALFFLALGGSVLASLAVVAGLGVIVMRGLRAEMAWRGMRLPSAATMLALLAWVGLDLLALSFVFWVLLPLGQGQDWAQVGTAFILSLTLGLMTGSPAGTGPFEALVVVQMPEIAPQALLAGLLAFRGVAYAVPAVLGAAWTLVGRAVLRCDQSAAP